MRRKPSSPQLLDRNERMIDTIHQLEPSAYAQEEVEGIANRNSALLNSLKKEKYKNSDNLCDKLVRQLKKTRKKNFPEEYKILAAIYTDTNLRPYVEAITDKYLLLLAGTEVEAKLFVLFIEKHQDNRYILEGLQKNKNVTQSEAALEAACKHCNIDQLTNEILRIIFSTDIAKNNCVIFANALEKLAKLTVVGHDSPLLDIAKSYNFGTDKKDVIGNLSAIMSHNKCTSEVILTILDRIEEENIPFTYSQELKNKSGLYADIKQFLIDKVLKSNTCSKTTLMALANVDVPYIDSDFLTELYENSKLLEDRASILEVLALHPKCPNKLLALSIDNIFELDEVYDNSDYINFAHRILQEEFALDINEKNVDINKLKEEATKAGGNKDEIARKLGDLLGPYRTFESEEEAKYKLLFLGKLIRVLGNLKPTSEEQSERIANLLENIAYMDFFKPYKNNAYSPRHIGEENFVLITNIQVCSDKLTERLSAYHKSHGCSGKRKSTILGSSEKIREYGNNHPAFTQARKSLAQDRAHRERNVVFTSEQLAIPVNESNVDDSDDEFPEGARLKSTIIKQQELAGSPSSSTVFPPNRNAFQERSPESPPAALMGYNAFQEGASESHPQESSSESPTNAANTEEYSEPQESKTPATDQLIVNAYSLAQRQGKVTELVEKLEPTFENVDNIYNRYHQGTQAFDAFVIEIYKCRDSNIYLVTRQEVEAIVSYVDNLCEIYFKEDNNNLTPEELKVVSFVVSQNQALKSKLP